MQVEHAVKGFRLGAKSFARRAFTLASFVVAATVFAPAGAQAAFPGGSGKLAFSSPRSGFPTESNLYTMAADGSAQTQVTNANGDDLYPAWSPNGAVIAFQRDAGLHPAIWSMNADGSNLRQLTSTATDEVHPAWSPDGTRIVFASDRATPGRNMSDLFVMNADGTGQTNISNTPTIDEDYPAWSPNGAKIAFSRDGDIATVAPDGTGLAVLTATERIEFEPDWSPNNTQLVYRAGVNADDEIYKMNADGSNVTNLTNTGPAVEERPAWSPAGDKIAFVKGAFGAAEVWLMNPDGSGQTRLTNNTFLDAQPSWQPLLQNYVRPSGTQRNFYSLVPAYTQCTSPNRTHGPGLAHPSCNPPVMVSPTLTVGTFDANGKPAGGVSTLEIKVLKGFTSTPTVDEADVKIITRVRDIFRRSDMSDYAGEARVELGIRSTDRQNSPYPSATGAGPGTGSFTLGFTIPCRKTGVTTRGGDCVLGTKADALVPGLVKESARTIWQLDQVRVLDGGADLDADTLADNRLFAVSGVFVP